MSSLSHEIIGNGLVLKPQRRIDSANAKLFEDQAHALVDQGNLYVVMDGSELDYISSAGLRVILTTAKKVKAAGGGLTIACAKDSVKEVLAVSGFDAIFGLHASVAAALESLGSK